MYIQVYIHMCLRHNCKALHTILSNTQIPSSLHGEVAPLHKFNVPIVLIPLTTYMYVSNVSNAGTCIPSVPLLPGTPGSPLSPSMPTLPCGNYEIYILHHYSIFRLLIQILYTCAPPPPSPLNVRLVERAG